MEFLDASLVEAADGLQLVFDRVRHLLLPVGARAVGHVLVSVSADVVHDHRRGDGRGLPLLQILHFRLQAGDLALQRGLWSAAVVNAEGERQTFKGNVHLVYRRQADGGWKVLTHTWN